MHVLMLFTSSSLHENFISKYASPFYSETCISRVIDVFLVLVSLKAGSTPTEFIAASAYLVEGKASFISLRGKINNIYIGLH
jgi:hypothetical protein